MLTSAVLSGISPELYIDYRATFEKTIKKAEIAGSGEVGGTVAAYESSNGGRRTSPTLHVRLDHSKSREGCYEAS